MWGLKSLESNLHLHLLIFILLVSLFFLPIAGKMLSLLSFLSSAKGRRRPERDWQPLIDQVQVLVQLWIKNFSANSWASKLQNFEFCRNDEQGGSDLKIMQPALAGPNPYQPFNLQELQIQLQLQFLKKRLLL